MKINAEKYKIILEFLETFYNDREDVEEDRTYPVFLKLVLTAITSSCNDCNQEAWLGSEAMRKAIESQSLSETIFQDNMSDLNTYKKMLDHS